MGAVSSPWHGQWRTQWERGREGEEWVRSGKVILSRVQSSCGSASCSVCHAMTWGDVMCMPLGAPEFRISRGERMRGRGLGRGQSVVVKEGRGVQPAVRPFVYTCLISSFVMSLVCLRFPDLHAVKPPRLLCDSNFCSCCCLFSIMLKRFSTLFLNTWWLLYDVVQVTLIDGSPVDLTCQNVSSGNLSFNMHQDQLYFERLLESESQAFIIKFDFRIRIKNGWKFHFVACIPFLVSLIIHLWKPRCDQPLSVRYLW